MICPLDSANWGEENSPLSTGPFGGPGGPACVPDWLGQGGPPELGPAILGLWAGSAASAAAGRGAGLWEPARHFSLVDEQCQFLERRLLKTPVRVLTFTHLPGALCRAHFLRTGRWAVPSLSLCLGFPSQDSGLCSVPGGHHCCARGLLYPPCGAEGSHSAPTPWPSSHWNAQGLGRGVGGSPSPPGTPGALRSWL